MVKEENPSATLTNNFHLVQERLRQAQNHSPAANPPPPSSAPNVKPEPDASKLLNVKPEPADAPMPSPLPLPAKNRRFDVWDGYGGVKQEDAEVKREEAGLDSCE